MNVRELIALLETCEPTSKISIYVPDPEDDGMEFVYEIDRVDRHWDHQECTGKPNAIGIVATERLAQLRVPDEETQNDRVDGRDACGASLRTTGCASNGNYEERKKT